MAVQANAFKGTAAASSFGKRNTPIESALGSELAANPPTIPVVDHKQDSGVETKTISTL